MKTQLIAPIAVAVVFISILLWGHQRGRRLGYDKAHDAHIQSLDRVIASLKEANATARTTLRSIAVPKADIPIDPSHTGSVFRQTLSDGTVVETKNPILVFGEQQIPKDTYYLQPELSEPGEH